jgi:hypothetical protein
LNAGGFKRFAVAVLKLACGISLAALVLGLIVWGIVALRERREAAAEAPLSILKSWPEVTVDALANTRFHLQTVWRGGNVYYQFDANAVSTAVRQARDHDTQAAFTISFLDKDGFKLFEHRLALQELTTGIGPDGQPASMSWKGDESINVDLYRRSARWEISWSGFSSVSVVEPITPPSASSILIRRPAATAQPKWKDVALWRELSRGISKDEVKRILGEPGKISEDIFQTTSKSRTKASCRDRHGPSSLGLVGQESQTYRLQGQQNRVQSRSLKHKNRERSPMHSVRTVTAGTTMSKFRERLRNGHFGSPFESAAWLLLLELYAALRPIDAITGRHHGRRYSEPYLFYVLHGDVIGFF